jgi:hypothetical protein
MLGEVTPDVSQFAVLNGEDWQALDAMAGEHRLRPMLHHRWSDNLANFIPEDLLRGWSHAHRDSAMAALAQRGDLLATHRLLGNDGITGVALKGSMLAWHAYPAAALRPLRDIDLLIGPDEAVRAWEILVAEGYEPLAQAEMAMDDMLRLAKHMPPLRARGGSVLELHMRPWQTQLPRGGDAPDWTGLVAEARNYSVDDLLLYPSPEDMLVHLAVHGCLSGAPLDCGPLLLSDVAYLVENSEIDWDGFWERGRAQVWSRPVAFALSLADRWFKPGLYEHSACPISIPDELIEQSPELLLQSVEDLDSAVLASTMSGSGKIGTVWSRLSGNRLGARRDFSVDGGFLRWFGSRAAKHGKALMRAGTRERASRMAKVTQWLVGDD